MFELTPDQRHELEGPQPARAIDPETKQEYVLVRADVYERMRTVFEEAGLDMRQVAILVEQAMRDEDAGDPSLESYQKHEQARRVLGDYFHPGEAYPAIDQAFSEAWDDPKMDDYDGYEKSK